MRNLILHVFVYFDMPVESNLLSGFLVLVCG